MTKKNNNPPSTLLEKSLKYAHKECIPMVATFEIIQNCNFKCSHCYNYDRSKAMPESLRAGQLSDEKILSVIEELSQEGTIFMNFSGGEASMHPHIEKFIEHSVLFHMQPRLKTNGYALTINKIKSLKESGLCGVDISLYGASEETYFGFTGKAGAFDKVVEAINNCAKAGLSVSVSLILHNKNAPELAKMISICKDADVSFAIQTEVTQRYDDSDGAKETEITDKQYKAFLTGEFSDFFKYKNKDNSLQCSCARSVCGISSTGLVYPCIGAPIIAGNINDDSFHNIWKNSKVFKEIRAITKESFKECSTCDHVDYCNRSSGGIYVNTGNYTGCDSSTFAQSKMQHDLDDDDL